ncbi:unnamed protein product [Owenia fusiformis]|uniref:Protein AF-10 n=1 Tax=Owenia fusiformis TaxID=6347 RepID=A0A8S4PG98_OWEFU|nr:unnamed protein product [Owenia fusiformis]
MKEMVGGCCVCSDERGWNENPLVYCDGHGCNVAVHQACYGIVQVPPGPWFCRKCESQERAARVKCELCPQRDGALKRTDSGGWGHVICALFIPEVMFGNTGTMEPICIRNVPHDRYNKSCYVCEEQGRESKATTGACMQCNKPGCKQYFHVTCAQAQGLLCEEAGAYMDNVKYCGYCSLHYKKLRKDHHNIKVIPPFKPIPSQSPDATPEKTGPITKAESKQKPQAKVKGKERTERSERSTRLQNPTATSSTVAESTVTESTATESSSSASKISASELGSKFTTANFTETVITPQTPPTITPKEEPMDEDDEDEEEEGPAAKDEAPKLEKSEIERPPSRDSNVDVESIETPEKKPNDNKSAVEETAVASSVSELAKEKLFDSKPTESVTKATTEGVTIATTSNSSTTKSESKEVTTSTVTTTFSSNYENFLKSYDKSQASSTPPTTTTTTDTSSTASSVPMANSSSIMDTIDSVAKGAGTASLKRSNSDEVSLEDNAEKKFKKHKVSPQHQLSPHLQGLPTAVKDPMGLMAGSRAKTVKDLLATGVVPVSPPISPPISQTKKLRKRKDSTSSMGSNMSQGFGATQSQTLFGVSPGNQRGWLDPKSEVLSNGPIGALMGPIKPKALSMASKGSSFGDSLGDMGGFRVPQSMEQLLERQWEQGSQFLMEQGQHFDIASLLNCLHQLRAENHRLEEHIQSLMTRRDHLLAVNARLSIPLTPINNQRERDGSTSQGTSPEAGSVSAIRNQRVNNFVSPESRAETTQSGSSSHQESSYSRGQIKAPASNRENRVQGHRDTGQGHGQSPAQNHVGHNSTGGQGQSPHSNQQGLSSPHAASNRTRTPESRSTGQGQPQAPGQGHPGQQPQGPGQGHPGQQPQAQGQTAAIEQQRLMFQQHQHMMNQAQALSADQHQQMMFHLMQQHQVQQQGGFSPAHPGVPNVPRPTVPGAPPHPQANRNMPSEKLKEKS